MANPACQLFSIAHRSWQTNQLHVFRRTNNGLFPDRATFNVAQIVEFIKDHEADIGQRGWNRRHITGKAVSTFFQEHIAVNFGGHDDDRCTAMLHNVSGHQANIIKTVHVTQITIFLIGERLQRGSIDDALVTLLCKPDGILSNDRFACTGRGRHHNRLPLSELGNGL